eukprot:TRINITY_DN109549_c0_g1_i1.p1 TRINITY_DN109549_c0_g1~~TRINITY_DN109549_c0_g1_i1.p1  ORF type:complete len:533 (+),score=101.29 TRINITY_DN109549_c0_g1_i1:35-1600(+)
MVSPAWQRWQVLQRRLGAGEVLVLDGGMGTEVEKIAGPEALNICGWSSSMNLTHPQAVKEAHRRFLDAGADIIIANTYGTNRHILTAAGLEAKTEENNRTAVRLALQAIKEWREAGGIGDPLVAGSVSIHSPGNEKSKMLGQSAWPAPEVEISNYVEQAKILIDAGVDMLYIEIVWNMEHGRRVVQALKSIADVPVFLGVTLFNDALCVESHDVRDGPLKVSKFDERVPKPHSDDAVPLGTAIQELLAGSPIVGVNLMHTKSDLVLKCLEAIRASGWTGPLGVYPDSGTWLRDGWDCNGLSPEILVEHAREWKEKTNTQFFGGCCGVGPEHIKALSKWARSFRSPAETGDSQGTLVELSRWYDREMRMRPLLTKTWTAFCMGALSNITAQLVRKRLAVREAFSWALQGSPPYSHFWFMLLDNQLGPGRAGLKTLLDQALWRPLLTLYVFVSNGLLNGNRWKDIKENVRKNLITVVLNGWKVWPAIMWLNQKYVPALYQSSAMDLAGFIWDVYMSLAQARSK